MPVGINVEDDVNNPGFVLLEFVNPTLQGKSLQALITAGGPDVVEPLSREKGSARKRYRVPQGNAAAAGLIDGSGTDLDDITQTGPADATGTVQPPVWTVKDNVHGPVIRKGTYKDGYGNNVTETQASHPVGQPPAEPTQAEVIEYVDENQKPLREREGRPPLVVPTITTTALPALVVNAAVNVQLAANGSTPMTWAVSAGTLPAGLALSAGGRITGTPTTEAAYDFTVRATNAKGNDTQQYTGNVAAAPVGFMAAPLVSTEPPAGTPLTPEEQVQADAAASTPEATSTPEPAVELVTYPEGAPSMDWTRPQLDAYALQVKNIDTSLKSEYPAKADVLAAIG